MDIGEPFPELFLVFTDSTPFTGIDVLDMDVNGRCSMLLRFYDESDAEKGPFPFVARQQAISELLKLLPIIWCDAKVGDLSSAMLERLKEPISYLMRLVALEWFTSSLMKGIWGTNFYVFTSVYSSLGYPIPRFPASVFAVGIFP